MNPDVQEKVRAEVKEVVRITNNMDYDTVKEMHYLEQCIKGREAFQWTEQSIRGQMMTIFSFQRL